ncbi:hypothetical protein Pres01_43680 [Metapseudomonas resinovorans]|nr:hypothetical protein Pres01_43680 [Pseudomonas resinovorans]
MPGRLVAVMAAGRRLPQNTRTFIDFLVEEMSLAGLHGATALPLANEFAPTRYGCLLWYGCGARFAFPVGAISIAEQAERLPGGMTVGNGVAHSE